SARRLDSVSGCLSPFTPNDPPLEPDPHLAKPAPRLSGRPRDATWHGSTPLPRYEPGVCLVQSGSRAGSDPRVPWGKAANEEPTSENDGGNVPTSLSARRNHAIAG